MIAVLRSYQHQPIPQWPLGFSINAALSVFGLIFKGPLLFVAAEGIGQLKWTWFSRKRALSDLAAYDDASRGPWDSTKLLYTARWRHLAAFLGALITVVALGVDPFTQAVVGYYACTTSTNKATANVGRLNSFFTQGAGYGLSTTKQIAIDSSFSDPTTIMPPHKCTTESCALTQSYHSIGLCTKCNDVTDQIQENCKPGMGGGCNYTLSAQYPSTLANTTTGYRTAPVAGGSSAGTYANWQVLSLEKYDYVMSSEGYMLPSGAVGLPSHVASTIDLVSASPILGCRCTIFWCVRTYTATIDSGVLEETLQSTSSNWSTWTSDSRVLGTVKVNCLTSQVQARLLSDGYISPTTEWMSWNGTYLNGTELQDYISDSHNLTIPIRCAYQAQLINEGLHGSPSEAFSDPLTGTLEGVGWNKTVSTYPESSSILVGIYNNGSISVDSVSRALDNFTTVATNYLRSLDSPIPKSLRPYVPSNMNVLYLPENPVHGVASNWNLPALGEAFKATTCINLRWPWLALPAALVVTTLAFLVTLIIQTADERSQEAWKSSQEALLWHGLDGPAGDESTYLVTTKEMHQRAKELRAHLGKTRRGWKLVQD